MQTPETVPWSLPGRGINGDLGPPLFSVDFPSVVLITTSNLDPDTRPPDTQSGSGARLPFYPHEREPGVLTGEAMKFPKHEAALHLTHNDHKSYYRTVAQMIADDDHGYRDSCWISEEQKQKAMVKIIILMGFLLLVTSPRVTLYRLPIKRSLCLPMTQNVH